ncbi:MAG: homoserine O-acetyltransferase [Spirochaetes bacterium]|nr:homoserine O-acetyltransferase [Spirochaetota bacterium]
MDGILEKTIVATQFFNFPAGVSLALDSGKTLSNVTIAYETYGTLSAKKDNAILICHALSGDAHAAFYSSAEDKKPGWWDTMIGPGKPFDTEKYFIICSNVIGGCKGSTGPSSVNPETGRPYGPSFPFITIGDMVRAQAHLIDHLGIGRLFAVAGGSMGGMQAMEWARSYPKRVRLCLPVATALYQSTQNIALHEIGRKSIMSDPNYRGGNFYDGEHPKAGLSIARMVGHISYLSDDAMTKKFGRRLQNMERYAFDLTDEFEVESYLDYQGESFIKRFDANSYIYITRAIDYFDIGYEAASLDKAFPKSDARFLVISFSSDWLYPPYQSEEIVTACKANHRPVTYVNITTNAGHDAFLIRNQTQEAVVRDFLDNEYRSIAEDRSHHFISSQNDIPRFDHRLIFDEIPSHSRVLDLGCGDGFLMHMLAKEKGCLTQGVEIDHANFLSCVSKRVDVIKHDFNDIFNGYPDNSFDYVLFNLTIQMTINASEALDAAVRVGRTVIVSFPNFAYIGNTVAFLSQGRMPKSKWLPFEWYDSPNIRMVTLKDFAVMCEEKGYNVRARYFYDETDIVWLLPNIFAPYCMFVFEKGR